MYRKFWGGCFAPAIQSDLDSLSTDQFLLYSQDGTKQVKTFGASGETCLCSVDTWTLAIVIDANKLTGTKVRSNGGSHLSSFVQFNVKKDGTVNLQSNSDSVNIADLDCIILLAVGTQQGFRINMYRYI